MHRKSSSRTKFNGKLLFAYGGKARNVGGKNFIDLISMVLLHDAIEQHQKSVKQGISFVWLITYCVVLSNTKKSQHIRQPFNNKYTNKRNEQKKPIPIQTYSHLIKIHYSKLLLSLDGAALACFLVYTSFPNANGMKY